MATAIRINQEQIDQILENSKFVFHHRIFGKQCVGVAQLPNGFTIVGGSACVDPKNYDEAIAEDLVEKDIKSKLWGFEGYLLQQSLSTAQGEV